MTNVETRMTNQARITNDEWSPQQRGEVVGPRYTISDLLSFMVATGALMTVVLVWRPYGLCVAPGVVALWLMITDNRLARRGRNVFLFWTIVIAFLNVSMLAAASGS
jgi:hypothetical protein